jgi:hypothetical protein
MNRKVLGKRNRATSASEKETTDKRKKISTVKEAKTASDNKGPASKK